MPTSSSVEIAQQFARQWLEYPLQAQDRKAIEHLLEPEQQTALLDAFLDPLAFGTGGLRARMGIGRSRMNIYSVGLITQGLAQYVISNTSERRHTAVIAYDSRLQSADFAEVCSKVLSANGIEAYLFPAPRPTPLLSFAVRDLSASLGIMITA